MHNKLKQIIWLQAICSLSVSYYGRDFQKRLKPSASLYVSSCSSSPFVPSKIALVLGACGLEIEAEALKVTSLSLSFSAITHTIFPHQAGYLHVLHRQASHKSVKTDSQHMDIEHLQGETQNLFSLVLNTASKAFIRN